MQTITTRYGAIIAGDMTESYGNGMLMSCMSIEPSPLATPIGTLTPQYTTDDVRKKEVQPVVFHRTGELKALPLEQQTVVSTPAGDIPAEFISFHPNGTVNRVFPLNGKLTGYWGQEDEGNMSKPVTLETPIGILTTRIIGIGFYDTGALRSITIWPGDTISVPTPLGAIETRIGVSFTPEGKVQTLEPAKPLHLKTIAGDVTAYDSDAVGINGDVNSLGFDENNEINSITTNLTRLTVVQPDGRKSTYTPKFRESLCGDSEQEIVPMLLSFKDETITIQMEQDGDPICFPRADHLFFTEPYLPQLFNPMGALRCSI